MDLSYKNEKTLFAIAVTISTIAWIAIVVGTIGIALIYVLLFFVVYLFAQSGFISMLKGNGVRVTAAQYPALHASLVRCCSRLGVEPVPDMYLLRTDFFNALATKFLGRNFIVLFTDVVDALEHDPKALDFYIGHELGHIHKKHLKWSVFLMPALFLPMLGTAYRRAQEYTCDRYGAACCDGDDQVRAALAAISAGNSSWARLNAPEYLKQIQETSGFWMSFHELTGDYPWLTKRMASALAFRRNETISHPRRNFFAGLLAMFVPRFGMGGATSLLLTIVMLGVLAAIAIPAYQDYAVRAQVAAALTDAANVRGRVERYWAENETWPNGLVELGFGSETLPTTDGRYQIGVYESGIIGITLGQDPAGQSRYLVLEPYLEGDAVNWLCYGQNAIEAQLPADCRQ